MSEFKYGDLVNITSVTQERDQEVVIWWDDVYIFLCHNPKGWAVLEDISSGKVYTAGTIQHVRSEK